AMEHLGVGSALGAKHLERHLSSEDHVLREENRAHAPLAKLRHDAILADGFTDHGRTSGRSVAHSITASGPRCQIDHRSDTNPARPDRTGATLLRKADWQWPRGSFFEQ